MAVYVYKTPKQLLFLPHQICSPAKFAPAPTSYHSSYTLYKPHKTLFSQI